MREGIVKKWTEALRSGKFAQTDGKLYNPHEDDGGYCCLGVLLEVASPFDWDAGSRTYSSDDPEMIEHYAEMCDVWDSGKVDVVRVEDEELPTWLMEWFGMKEHEHKKFIELNDTHGASFTEIADEIERTYLQRRDKVEKQVTGSPKVTRVKGKALPWTITQGDNVIELDDQTALVLINMMRVLAHGE